MEGRLHRPTLRNTINGCIYYAMKRIKKGSDRSVHLAALEDGLADLTVLTGNPQKKLVQDELRRLARWKIILRTRRVS